MKRIGIFGGSFDPFHNGHFKILECFINQFELDFCYLVPTNNSPLKESKPFLNTEEKLYCLSLISRDLKVKISDFEIQKVEKTYSIDTINFLKKLHPNDEFFLLIGQDQAADFKKWKDFELILKKVNLVIADRINESNINETIQQLQQFGQRIFILNFDTIDLSSTYIREMLLNKKIPQGKIPDSILDFILKNKFLS